MKKEIILLVAIISILATGCSYDITIRNHDTYKGENADWTGEYEISRIVTFPEKEGKKFCEKEDKGILTLTYKKDLSELSDVKQLEISYKDSFGNSGGTLREHYDAPPTKKEYHLNVGSGTATQELSERFMAPDHLQQSLLILTYPRTDQNGLSIPVTIRLDGKEQNLELPPYDSDQFHSLDFDQLEAYLFQIKHPRLYFVKTNPLDLSFTLTNVKVSIKNVVESVGEGDASAAEKDQNGPVVKELCYEIAVQNNGDKIIGDPISMKDLEIELIPGNKLRKASKDAVGIDIFDGRTAGFGRGQSMGGDMLNSHEVCNVTLTYDLDELDGNSQALLKVPTADQLAELRRNAADASLVLIYQDEEIARLDLNEDK